MEMNMQVKNVMINGAPEDEVRELLKMVKSGNIKELYTSIHSYKVSYETGDLLSHIGNQEKFFAHPQDFLVEGLLAEGAIVVENGENIQVLTNAYSGFALENLVDIVTKSTKKFEKAQVMYIWNAPLKF